ncbi:MAG: hypothetical protein HHJ09_08915 [Glaciimonas sp.]|nr:hypothetical protein [Glaciimonas sp.]
MIFFLAQLVRLTPVNFLAAGFGCVDRPACSAIAVYLKPGFKWTGSGIDDASIVDGHWPVGVSSRNRCAKRTRYFYVQRKVMQGHYRRLGQQGVQARLAPRWLALRQSHTVGQQPINNND